HDRTLKKAIHEDRLSTQPTLRKRSVNDRALIRNFSRDVRLAIAELIGVQMSKHHEPGIDLGIVGGMGPLASAEFVRTVYEYGLGEREQPSPTVLLYSDPTFPDRTDAFMSGNDAPVLEKLIDVITR